MDRSDPFRLLWLAAAALLITTFAMTGTWSIRRAVADYWFRQANLSGTERAIRLEPDNSEYYRRLAIVLQEKDPAASTQALHHALEINPRDSESRVEVALRAEASGDFAAAEQGLLSAAGFDRTYLPRWSLANFYFRHDKQEKFWFWAREAVAMAYGDLAPLFGLCWRVTSDGTIIEQKLDIRKADAAASYLAYLTAEHRDEAISRAARRVLAWNRDADVPSLMAACDRLIGDERPSQALMIWNELARLRRIPYDALQPESGRFLTNGDFRALPTSQGFDWRLGAPDGLVFLLQDQHSGLRIQFSGRQPEICEVLMQYLPLRENSRYALRFRYRTSGIAPGTGLAWRITDSRGAQTLAAGKDLASESDAEERLDFQSSPANRLVRLALVYHRALGTTRIAGTVTLLGIGIVPMRGDASVR